MRALTPVVFLLAVLISVPEASAAKARAVRGTPTFSNEVVRLFQRHCQSCHRDGAIAPFPLLTYADAKPRAALIKAMTSTHRMPPWPPSDQCHPLQGERRMSQQEIDLIARWADAGAPEGKRADLPKPLALSEGWTLGRPDQIFRMPEPYVPPAGVDTYRCFPIANASDTAKYVSAIDTRPGDLTAVHHAAVYIDTKHEAEALDAADPGPGYGCFGGPRLTSMAMLGGWGPGARPLELPDGVGIEIPARAGLVLQVHYHGHRSHANADHTHPDQTELGVYYAAAKPKQLMRFVVLHNLGFSIPADDPAYDVRASMTTTAASKIWLVAPHMHLLGKSMRVEATLPGGRNECLVDVPRWDFNWQGAYLYRDPISLPAGTRIALHAQYDNSAANPRNPNSPPKTVSWGEWTTDEMCVVLFGMTDGGP